MARECGGSAWTSRIPAADRVLECRLLVTFYEVIAELRHLQALKIWESVGLVLDTARESALCDVLNVLGRMPAAAVLLDEDFAVFSVEVFVHFLETNRIRDVLLLPIFGPLHAVREVRPVQHQFLLEEVRFEAFLQSAIVLLQLPLMLVLEVFALCFFNFDQINLLAVRHKPVAWLANVLHLV